MATITVGTNSYIDASELSAYAADRGAVLTGDIAVLLIRAMDFLESQRYVGTRVSADLSWPRTGVSIDGIKIDGVPQQIKDAQAEIALIYDQGGDLYATLDRPVRSESVDVLSVEYASGGNQNPVYPRVMALLSPFLASGGQLAVSRG